MLTIPVRGSAALLLWALHRYVLPHHGGLPGVTAAPGQSGFALSKGRRNRDTSLTPREVD